MIAPEQGRKPTAIMVDNPGRQPPGPAKSSGSGPYAWLQEECALPHCRYDDDDRDSIRHVEPLCRLCLERGHVVPATVADHIEPHRGDYNAFRLGELRSPCALRHDRLNARYGQRSPANADGTPSGLHNWWNAHS